MSSCCTACPEQMEVGGSDIVTGPSVLTIKQIVYYVKNTILLYNYWCL